MPRYKFSADLVLDPGVDPNSLHDALNGREGVQVVSVVVGPVGDQYVVKTVNTETREVGSQTVVADTDADAASLAETETLIVIGTEKVETEASDESA